MDKLSDLHFGDIITMIGQFLNEMMELVLENSEVWKYFPVDNGVKNVCVLA